MAHRRPAVSDVTLDDERSYRDRLVAPHYTGKHLLENNSFLITGETDQHDLVAVSLTSSVDGEAWGGRPAALRQTNFMAIPKGRRKQGLTDNDFIGCRPDPVHSQNLSIVEEPDRIIWKVGAIEHVARPPYWDVRGEHFGVQFDLTVGGLSAATRWLGGLADIEKNGRAGFYLPCWFDGTIIAAGTQYTLQSGLGTHGRYSMGDQWVTGAAMERRSRHYWMWCLSEDLRIFCFLKEVTGTSYGCFRAGEQEVFFGKDQIAVTELESWEDPRTSLRVPSQLSVRMESDLAQVQMWVRVYGRFFYTYCLAEGIITYYGLMCRTDGVITTDTAIIPIRDMRSFLEHGIYPIALQVN